MTTLSLKDTQKALKRTYYRGINFMKNPNDAVIYQMIMHDIRPDLIIEIGTLKGGSALYFADLMTVMGIDGEVHTIDLSIEASDGTIRQPKTEIPDIVLDHPKVK